jgi:membrane associated rhomboid family serine protease
MAKENVGQYIKRLVLQSGMVGKLIAANTIVFLVFVLIGIFGNLTYVPEIDADGFLMPSIGSIAKGYFIAPGLASELIYKPWSVITYMFTHADFRHFFFNMIMLYFSGRIFVNFFGERRLLLTYILGGIFAYALHVFAYSVFPGMAVYGYPNILGASGSIMAVFIGAAFYQPGYKVNLLGVLSVQLFILAAIYVISDLAGLGSESRTAYIAHLGGALFGGLSVINALSSKNFMNRIDRFIFKLKVSGFSFKRKQRKPKMKVHHSTKASTQTDDQYNADKVAHKARIDAILDKISKKGYEGLSKAEKDILFNESKR